LTGTRAKLFKEVSALREHDEYSPPDDAIKALARRLYPAMVAYFESDRGKREFAEWQAKQGAKATGRENESEKTLGLAA
jgi:hypothetical protein